MREKPPDLSQVRYDPWPWRLCCWGAYRPHARLPRETFQTSWFPNTQTTSPPHSQGLALQGEQRVQNLELATLMGAPSRRLDLEPVVVQEVPQKDNHRSAACPSAASFRPFQGSASVALCTVGQSRMGYVDAAGKKQGPVKGEWVAVHVPNHVCLAVVVQVNHASLCFFYCGHFFCLPLKK